MATGMIPPLVEEIKQKLGVEKKKYLKDVLRKK
jgi:hypothetical protein